MRRRLLLAAPLLMALAGCQTALDSLGMGEAQRFVLFFTEDSAQLGTSARGIIAQAADAAKERPRVPVRVLGFAAPDTGSAQFNRALSEARARQVADGLVAAGVAQSRISVVPRGAVPFEMFPQESRRVDIEIGG